MNAKLLIAGVSLLMTTSALAGSKVAVSGSYYKGGSSSGYAISGGYRNGSYGGSASYYKGGGYGGGYGYYGGYKGGYYGYKNWYGGGCYPKYYSSCNSWYPWGLSFSYVAATAPVYYYSPPAPVYVTTPSPTVVYTSPPATTTVVTPPPPQPLSVADIKALTRAGLDESVIINQIRSTKSVFRLSTAEIIDMKDAGVSQNVINFMINSAS